MTKSIVLLLTLLLPCAAFALPPNFRSVEEQFYASGLPGVEDMEELHALGVRTIISLRLLEPDAAEAAGELGILVYENPLETALVQPDKMLGLILSSEPQSVLIHCMHGADRTGVLIAYWLVMSRGWHPGKALVSVLNSAATDREGLRELLRQEGLEMPSTDDLGRYAGPKGGLKVRGGSYNQLIRSFLYEVDAWGYGP